MKNKKLLVIIALIVIACLLSACEKQHIHNFGEWVSDATSHWKECKCGMKSDLTLHNYTTVVTPPIETEKGYTTYTCGECGFSYKDELDYSNGFEYKINEDNKTCTITDVGTCTDTRIVIPSAINGYKVTKIGSGAFIACTNLVNVIIPDGVTSIEEYAFYQCINLTNITISTSVTSIGGRAFYNCDGLTNIIIPDSVTSIGDYAFVRCTSLTNITIPDSVTSIGNGAFYNCDGLTRVTIGNSVTTISRYTFEDCSNLVAVTIPKSVTTIDDDAFDDCYSLGYVKYKGTESDWNNIAFGGFNSCLTNATIHYNA